MFCKALAPTGGYKPPLQKYPCGGNFKIIMALVRNKSCQAAHRASIAYLLSCLHNHARNASGTGSL
ncbi:MAG: hypothetical protein FWE44_05465 [Defluviitaleaceae bacterium]|nr:hypothetical protein [Defluviitaleaceae bacterium]